MIKERLSKDGTMGYLPERGATVTLGNPLSADSKGPKAPAKKPDVAAPDNTNNLDGIASWGSDNLFPQNVMKDAYNDPFMHPLNKLKEGIMYGAGIEVVIADVDDNGEEVISRDATKFPDLKKAREFNRNANVPHYIQGTLTDFYWFYNPFPELIVSNDHSEIVNINRLMAKNCRWSEKEKGELVSKYCYLNGAWDNGGNRENSTPIPTIDPYNFAVENLKKNTSLKKFVYPCSYPDPDNPYYTLAPWNVYRTSKWSEFVKKVPEFKAALMKNQMLVRWHIEISTEYWGWRYGEDWKRWNEEERFKKINEVLDELDNRLAGSENAGKALLTHNLYDPIKKEYHNLIKINKLDDKVQSGAYVEDSAEGSQFAMVIFGLHPTIVGNAPGAGGSSMGAGSGSDQRVAWNNYLFSCQMEKDIILAPLHFIRDYNGWDSRLQWRFKHQFTATLDVNKEPQQMSS